MFSQRGTTSALRKSFDPSVLTALRLLKGMLQSFDPCVVQILSSPTSHIISLKVLLLFELLWGDC